MRKLFLLFAVFSIIGLQVYGQRTITGTITGDDGTGLPGVSVSVKGTTIGTMTSADGSYSIEAPDGSEFLIFSYIGMETQEVAISGDVVNFVMEASDTALDEVVVIALGVSRDKKSLGYSVQDVSGSDLNRAKSDNVINSISGKISGVQIKNNSNMGGSSNILIRGSSSLTGNNQALFVVDGVPVNDFNSNTKDQVSGRSGYDYGSPVSDINPNDIENMSVLKGAAATALYGSRAANGVILITTKKGKKGKNNVTVGVNHSTMFHVMDENTFPKYQNKYGAGYGPYYSDSDYPGLELRDFDGDGIDDYVIPSTEDASMGSPFNSELMVYQWDSFFPESPTYMKKSPYIVGANGPEYFFETGRTITNSFNVAGGTEVSAVRLSYTNTDQTGILPNSSIKKNSISFSGSYDLTDKITVSASTNYVNAKSVGRNHTGYSDNIMSMFRQWYNLGVDMKMQEDYYNLTKTNMTWNPSSEDNLAPIYWDNPYWARYENYQSDERDRLIGYTQLDWELTDNLSFMARYSLDHYNALQEERKAIGSVAGEFGVGLSRLDVQSGYARREILFTETNFDAMLKFNKNLTEDINFNAMVGTSMRRSTKHEVFSATNGGLAVPEVFALSNSASPMLPPEEDFEQIGVDGILGSVSFGIKNMLFIDGTYRYDISSTLPTDENGYGYWGTSLGFLFSEIIDAQWMNLGKVRLSYAQVGNDAPWGRVNDTYSIVSPFDGNTLVEFPRAKNNPDLKPEISTSSEAGIEFVLLKNRIGLDLAAYKTNTIDAVIPLAISRVTGYRSKYVNIGELENKGIEIMLRLTPVRSSSFSWDITLNWAKNINEVVSLGDDIDNLQLTSLQGGVTINAREGEPYGVIQGTDYVYSPDGQKVVGSNSYYEKTGTSDKILGNVQPDWNAGFGNTISFKGFTLNLLIDMQMGGSIFSLDQWYGMGTGLYEETVYNNELGNPVRSPIVENEDGTYASNSGGMILDGVVGIDNDGDGEYDSYETNIQRTPGETFRVWGWSRNPNAGFIYDATYVKLRELSLTYSLPQSMFSKTFISGASVGIVGSNLWILYKDLPHADPEASQGAGNIQGWQSGVMPTTRNIGFNINLTF